MFLAVIKPPNNSETALLEIRRRLFRETGILQVWALRPFIPLGIASGEAVKINRAELPPMPPEGFLIDELSEAGGHYILTSESCRSFCDSFLDSPVLGIEPGSGFPGLHFYDPDGLDREASERLNKRIRDLLSQQPESVLKWKSVKLEICRTEPGIFRKPGWWRRVVLETVVEISFPKSRPL